MSAAEACPAFTKKFAWRSLTRASPCEKPFSPSSSIIRPAEPPGGFLKMQPALFCPSGWLERRFSLQMRMHWRISEYGLEGSFSFTASIISSGAKEVCRYSNEICLPWSISILRSAARYPFTSRTYEPIWMPYAPAFMRNAPPTVPGTPINPSMPPKLFFAQNVTVRPRSAAASTLATFPSRTISGSPLTNCRTTNGNSPSTTSKFDPPPRNLCGTPCASRSFSNPGIASCFRIRSRSVVPPMPSDVNSASETPRRSSAPNSESVARILESSIRISNPVLHAQFRPQQHHQFAARPADVPRPNGHNRVTRPRFPQQKLNRILHRAEILHVFVPRLTNTICQRLAGDSWNRSFSCRIHIHQRQNIRLVKRLHKLIPQMLSPGVPMWLEERQQSGELAASCRLQRRPNFRRMMTVVVHHRNVVHHALDIEPPPHAREFRQALTDQVAGHIQIKRHGRRSCGISNVVNSWRVRQQKHPQILAFVRQAKFRSQSAHFHVADHQIRLRRSSIRNNRPLHIRNNRLHVRLVQAQNRRPIKRHAVHKLKERLLNVFERGILVQVLAVNRRNHRHYRREHQEAPVAFVRLHHKIFSAPHARGSPRLIHLAANHKRRIQMRRRQNRRHHGSSSGF